LHIKVGSQSSIVVDVLPDVEFTSIDGTVHRPYDYLNSGKIVIFDFFSTSCAPCWEYHESQSLQSIYETFGPDGSDEVMVFIVEGNLNTSLDDLAGNGYNTFGNYLDCSPYPVIDDHEFAFNMGIHEDPTLLFVCPDKKVAEIGQLPETELVDLINNSCPTNNHHNNLELLYFSCNLDPSCGETDFIPTIMVQNNGTNTIEHVSLQLQSNGEILTDSVGFDLFIEQYETTELPFEFGEILHTTEIDITVLTVNHQIDTLLEANALSGVKPVLRTEDENITVSITTDQFGYEIYWEILDENEYQVASGGNELVLAGGQQDVYHLLESPNHYSPNTIYHESVTLNNEGCYTFRIYDDWGDGICCEYGSGKFEILNNAGEVILNNSSFLKELSVDFQREEFPVSSVELIHENEAPFLYPNPINNFTTLSFVSSISNNFSVDVYNQLGQKVDSRNIASSIGENTIPLDFSNLWPGNYYLSSHDDVLRFRLQFQIFRD